MTADLTFNQINQELGKDIFEIIDDPNHSNSGTPAPKIVQLNITELTGDEHSSLDETGIIETVYKLLDACNSTQDKINENNDQPLRSFTKSFGNISTNDDGVTVQTIRIELTANAPLDIDNLTGVN